MLRMLEDPQRRAARHDAREPDPGHPRDQPRHHLPPHGPPRQRPRGQRPRHPDASTSTGRCATPRPRASRRSSSRRSRCGSTASPTIENDPLKLDREVDWVIKHKLIEALPRQRHDLPLGAPPGRAARPAVPRRQPRPRPLLQAAGRGAWSSACAPTPTSTTAVETPPQTTRARLRGEFIRRAKERKRDYTVDWVHLKLNDQAQRTVLCKDPFKRRDERVEKLIASLCSAVPRSAPRTVTRASSRSGPASSGSTPTEGRAYVLTQLTGPVAVGDGSCSTPPRSTSASAPAAGTSCTGTWPATSWSEPGPGPHHEAALHEPPGRHRRRPRSTARGAAPTSAACPWWSCSAPQPGARRRRRRSSASRPTRAHRLRDDRRRRAAARALRPRRRPARAPG